MNAAGHGPALVISLDFELHWGVTERVRGPEHPYSAHLHGAREAIPRLLEIFQKRGIHATWATVGMLFARGATDLEAYKPTTRPGYERAPVDNYQVPVGESEQSDRLHFAPSLIEQIQSTPGQELACHTFSHYYCDELGQGVDAFRADLAAAKAIATRDRVVLRSLVFPRNQVLPDYLSAVQDAGITSYRGNPPGAMYHLPGIDWKRGLVRAVRLVDSFVNITGHHTVPWSHIAAAELSDVRASRFLRPYSCKLRLVEPLRRRRVKAGLRTAALRGEVYHLWWHPHNFGVNLEENLAALESILDEFERLRTECGMRSLSMEEAADLAQRQFRESGP